LQGVIEIGDLGVPPRRLQFYVGDCERQQTFEPVFAAFGFAECRPFVQTRVAKKIILGRVFLSEC
jgi:hypothetical protein